MEQDQIFSSLADVLLPWYDLGHRDLPWRRTKDPYCVWLSEIMLQQTRVEAVKGYYHRFLSALPTISHLADAELDQLHKLWEGLGYYSRVRNLQKAAKVIMEQHGGAFPREYNEVLALPGIGAYTAGAICSIAFEQKTPAVDGNVLRVVARLTSDETSVDLPAYKKQVTEQLAKIYPDRAGDFTQALMELGATVCGPNRTPDCENCPCKGFCRGYALGTAQKLPVRNPKRGRKQQEMTVFILRCDGQYGLRKRPEDGLLGGMWEFPHVPGKLELPQVISSVEEMGLIPSDIHRQVEKKHIFTHIEWHMRGYYLQVREKTAALEWFAPDAINEAAALPTAFRQFWEDTEDV